MSQVSRCSWCTKDSVPGRSLCLKCATKHKRRRTEQATAGRKNQGPLVLDEISARVIQQVETVPLIPLVKNTESAIRIPLKHWIGERAKELAYLNRLKEIRLQPQQPAPAPIPTFTIGLENDFDYHRQSQQIGDEMVFSFLHTDDEIGGNCAAMLQCVAEHKKDSTHLKPPATTYFLCLDRINNLSLVFLHSSLVDLSKPLTLRLIGEYEHEDGSRWIGEVTETIPPLSQLFHVPETILQNSLIHSMELDEETPASLMMGTGYLDPDSKYAFTHKTWFARDLHHRDLTSPELLQKYLLPEPLFQQIWQVPQSTMLETMQWKLAFPAVVLLEGPRTVLMNQSVPPTLKVKLIRVCFM